MSPSRCGWLGWDGYVNFWTNLVGETFPRTRDDLSVTSKVVDGKVEVRVEGQGDFEEGSEARARVVGPDLQAHDIPLERVGSNVFAGSQAVTAAGSYSVAAQVIPPGADAGSASVGGDALASLSFSPEYEPGAADPSLLRRIAEETGGRADISPSSAFDPEGLPAGRSHVPLARWLLVLAALLWPVAVALSRLALRGSVVGQAHHVGATALWWVRSHLPPPPRSLRRRGRRRLTSLKISSWEPTENLQRWRDGGPVGAAPADDPEHLVLAVELEASRRDPYRRLSRLFHLLARRH